MEKGYSKTVFIVRRPGNERHFMRIEMPLCSFVAEVDGKPIARSRRAVVVHEAAGNWMQPVVYFPLEDVFMDQLHSSGKQTECPLKGVADYYHIRAGESVIKNAAWIYALVYRFDPGLQTLSGRMAFDRECVVLREDANTPRN